MVGISPQEYRNYRQQAVTALDKALNKWQELKTIQHPEGKNTDFKPSELFNIIEICCTDEQVSRFIEVWKQFHPV